MIIYHAGAELGPAQLTLTANGELVDLTTPTITVDVVHRNQVVRTKTSGLAGSAEAPNLTINWAADELDLEPGTYTLQVQARDSDLDYRWQVPMRIAPWATPAA